MALMMESGLEIAAGVAVELLAFAIAAAVVYRLFAGRFLLPKRELVLPNQIAVLVHRDEQLGTFGPGRHWVRPGRKLILFDARPRSLHIEGLGIVSQDGAVLRLSVSGQYSIADAITYYRANTQTADAFYSAVRRELQTNARMMNSEILTSSTGAVFLADLVKEQMTKTSKQLGMHLDTLELWGVFQTAAANTSEPVQSTGFVH